MSAVQAGSETNGEPVEDELPRPRRRAALRVLRRRERQLELLGCALRPSRDADVGDDRAVMTLEVRSAQEVVRRAWPYADGRDRVARTARPDPQRGVRHHRARGQREDAADGRQLAQVIRRDASAYGGALAASGRDLGDAFSGEQRPRRLAVLEVAVRHDTRHGTGALDVLGDRQALDRDRARGAGLGRAEPWLIALPKASVCVPSNALAPRQKLQLGMPAKSWGYHLPPKPNTKFTRSRSSASRHGHHERPRAGERGRQHGPA